MVSIDWTLPAADSEASRCTLACEQALLIGLACVVGARKNGRALVRSFLCPQLPSACYASYIWASEAIRAKTRERAAKSPPPRFLVSFRSLLARLLFTISPKWRACLKASRTRVKPSGTQGTEWTLAVGDLQVSAPTISFKQRHTHNLALLSNIVCEMRWVGVVKKGLFS